METPAPRSFQSRSATHQNSFQGMSASQHKQRDVPLRIRLSCLFGGFLNQFGWFFFGFGMIFFWAFVGNADFSFIHYLGRGVQTEAGVVSQSEETNASEGGSDSSPGTPIYANHFSFEYGGVTHSGVSYAVGDSLGSGAKVEIEFPEGAPKHARIKNMRAGIFSPAVLFVLIFPLVGLCFLVYGMKQGKKAARLLEYGALTEGELKSKEPTATEINNRPVYKLTFEFAAQNGQTYRAEGRTHLPEKLEDDARERLLYDPSNPENAMMLDILPGSPQFDAMGRIEQGSGNLAVITIPAISIIGHGAYLLNKFTT